MSLDDKIVLLGGAGLVGQNLSLILREHGYRNVVIIDKNPKHIDVMRRIQPFAKILEFDLAVRGEWEKQLSNASVVIILHAQIGGENAAAFDRNNIKATKNILDSCRNVNPYIIHVSSSVVNSMAIDWYTESKKKQENLIVASGYDYCILRPTLMFGWFDQKHLGWLTRFMEKAPIFPIPGHGRYPRQPLYVRNFCRIIRACLDMRPKNKTYDISGREKIDYIDIIYKIKHVKKISTPIIRIPYFLFWIILKIVGVFNQNAPFTTKQLRALATSDEFPLTEWWNIFGVEATSFHEAVKETFGHPLYSVDSDA